MQGSLPSVPVHFGKEGVIEAAGVGVGVSVEGVGVE
jgi:hypothetical protein